MIGPVKQRRPCASVVGAVAALIGLDLIVNWASPLAFVNESPSLPRGLYLRRPGAPIAVGAVVVAPQPEVARPYLASLGIPPEVRLIKRVAAASGDVVCREGGAVRISSRTLAVRDRDQRGVSLPAWEECRRLRAGEVFLLGDTPASFDSRYFGPVHVRDLEGVFQESVTW
jgi:type IV secretory pathway protease TraF